MKTLKYIFGLACLALIFQNCAKHTAGVDPNLIGVGDFGSTDDPYLKTPAGIKALQAPHALLNGEQILKTMLNVSGTSLTNPVKTEFTSRSNSFSSSPDVSATNAPLLLAVTSLGGEVCNNLVSDEKSKTDTNTRNIFSTIDFSSPSSSITAEQFDSIIRAMARSFWGRNETATEKQFIVSGRTDFETDLEAAKKTTAASTSDLMIYTCAAMISSVDAITY